MVTVALYCSNNDSNVINTLCSVERQGSLLDGLLFILVLCTCRDAEEMVVE